MNPPPSQEERAEKRVRFRIVCRNPPSPERFGAEFGLQDNSTTLKWMIHPGQVSANGDRTFECECRVRPQKTTGAPNFLGPFVQGSAHERFFYLSWRPRDRHAADPEPPCGTWNRRMKVHLRSITWEQIDEAIRINGVLEAAVEGTGRDGGPSCASVPLIGGGWLVRKK